MSWIVLNIKFNFLCIKMKFQKIVNLFDTTSDDKDLPRFVTKKWIEVYDQTGRNCNINKEIRNKTSILRSDLSNFSDAYIVVEEAITVNGRAYASNKRNKSVAFKNNAPFANCISKVNGAQIDNAEDLDVVMPMYNLLEYSKNYKKKQQQAVYEIITETNQIILFLVVLNLLNTRHTLLEKHQIMITYWKMLKSLYH